MRYATGLVAKFDKLKRSPPDCVFISGTLRPQDDFEVAQSDGVRDRSISTRIVIRREIRRFGAREVRTATHVALRDCTRHKARSRNGR